MKKISTKKIEFLLMLAIILLASFLRLYKIADYMTFLGDEGRDVLVVKRMIVDHRWTLLGPTASVGGFFLGPLYYYMMAPFLFLSGLNPAGPAYMVALFGIATVFLVYFVGKKWFGIRVGIVSAALYSISPLVVGYSRSSWNPNLVPFFSLLIIYNAWLIAQKKSFSKFLILGILFGMAIQFHYLTAFLGVIVVIYLLFFYRSIRDIKYYLLTLLGFLVGWSPFLLFEIRHGFPNFITFYKFFRYGNETGFVLKRFLPIVSDVAYRLFNRLVTNNHPVFALFLLFGSLTFLLYLIRPILSRKEKATNLLCILWFFLGIVLFGFYQKGIYDYYFGFMFPLPFILSSALLVTMSRKKTSLYLSALLVGYLLWINLQGIPFRYAPNRQLDQTKNIAKIVFDKAGGRPFNFGLITGGNSDFAYRYFFEIWGNPPVTILNSEADPERKSVTDQLLVICESIPCYPEGHSLWEIAGFGRAKIVDQEQGPVGIMIYRLVHYVEK